MRQQPAPSALVGPGLPLLDPALVDPALGSVSAFARTNGVAHFVFDWYRVAEARPAVRFAPLHSTVHGLGARRDCVLWPATCAVIGIVSSPTDDDPAARFARPVARSKASRSRGSDPPSSAGLVSALHPADHVFAFARRGRPGLRQSIPNSSSSSKNHCMDPVASMPTTARALPGSVELSH